MNLDAGVQIGRYEIGRRLGQGGFGILYAARDAELGRDIAIKILRPEHAFRPQLVQRFLQEARAAARISHPGIVTVYESGEVSGTNTRADGTVYIAMELLAGDTLGLRLKQSGQIPYRMALGYCRQIATALAAAHQAGIVHRDLKPQNVFIVADAAVLGGERIKILDFGIAKLIDDMGSAVNTHSMLMLGTPMYMSPEQCKSSARVDSRSDIYSLGCILFEMVTGKTPFSGDSGELIAKHQLMAPPTARSFNPELPVVLDQLIASMLAKNPDERPQTMSLVLDVLSECDDRSVEPPSLTEHRALLAEDGTFTGTTLADGKIVRARSRFRSLLTGFRIRALSGRMRVALGAVAAAIVGMLIGFCSTRGGGNDDAKTARSVRVAEISDASEKVDPPPTAPGSATPAIAELKVECLQAQIEKRWTDLQSCGERLVQIDANAGKGFVDIASTELANEESLSKLERALEANNLKAAKAAFDEIEESSVFYRVAQTLYSTARPADPVTTASQPPPDRSGAKKCDPEGLRDQGLAEQQRGKHKAALARFESSLQCQADQYVEKLAFVAACNDRNQAKAKEHYAKLTDKQRADSASACERNKIKLPTICDADELKDQGINAVTNGQHALALTKFESSLRCKHNAYVLQLAFMESCAANNSNKAMQFYRQLSPAQQQKFAQMCIRTSTKYQ